MNLKNLITLLENDQTYDHEFDDTDTQGEDFEKEIYQKSKSDTLARTKELIGSKGGNLHWEYPYTFSTWPQDSGFWVQVWSILNSVK